MIYRLCRVRDRYDRYIQTLFSEEARSAGRSAGHLRFFKNSRGSRVFLIKCGPAATLRTERALKLSRRWPVEIFKNGTNELSWEEFFLRRGV